MAELQPRVAALEEQLSASRLRSASLAQQLSEAQDAAAATAAATAQLSGGAGGASRPTTPPPPSKQQQQQQQKQEQQQTAGLSADADAQRHLALEVALVREQYAARLVEMEGELRRAELSARDASAATEKLFAALVQRTAALLAGRLAPSGAPTADDASSGS
eukprot:156375-Chlamydomonas_euryale.AAC.3